VGGLLVLPYAPGEPLPPPWQERVTLLAVPFFIAANPRLRVHDLDHFAANAIRSWIEQLPDHAAARLAPPILELTHGSLDVRERRLVALRKVSWPLPAHPEVHQR
jgi:hypothetical protein